MRGAGIRRQEGIPELVVACVIGNGEAETRPLAASWHGNKFLDPVDKQWNAPIRPIDEHLAPDGRVVDPLGAHLPGLARGLPPDPAGTACSAATRRSGVYLPAAANCLLPVADHCLRSRNYVNAIVAGKQPTPTWLAMEETVLHCARGLGIWELASTDERGRPDVVLACAGDLPTLETLAAAHLIHRLPSRRWPP